MASRTDTARPAARKGQATKQTKTIAKKTTASSNPMTSKMPKAATKPVARRLEPIIQTVDRNAHRPVVDVPKVRGELPVPIATFYF